MPAGLWKDAEGVSLLMGATQGRKIRPSDDVNFSSVPVALPVAYLCAWPPVIKGRCDGEVD